MKRVSDENNGTFNIVLACGGSFQQTIEGIEKIIGKSIVVYVDTEKEVSKCNDKNVIRVPLAEHATTEELCANFKGDERYAGAINLINAGPGMDISKGAGQFPLMGEMQFKFTLENTDLMQHLENELVNRLYLETRGEVSKVNIMVLSSAGGGVGSGTAIAMANLVSKIVYESTGTRAAVIQVRLGGLSYIGCGSRTTINTKYATDELQAWMNNRDGKLRSPGETRTTYLLETPMVQKDKESRDKLNRVTVTSMFSDNVSEYLQISTVNHIDFADNPFPGVFTIRPCYFGGLEIRDIHAAIAAHIINMSDRAEARDDETSSGNPNVEVDVELEETETYEVDTRLLVDTAKDKNIDELKESAKTTGKSYGKGSIFIRVNSDSKLNLGSMADNGKEPETLEEYRERMNLLVDIREKMQQKLREASEEAARTDIRLKKAGKKLDESIKGMSQESPALTRLVDGVYSFFSKSYSKNKKKSFGKNTEKFRKAKTEEDRLNALKKTLQMGISFIDGEINKLKGKMKVLMGMLVKVRNAGSLIDSSLVELKEEAGLFGKLLNASSLGQESLNEEIEKTGAVITEYGIKRILNLPTDTTMQQVAWKLVREQADEIAPYWGGKKPRNSALYNFIVLPPVSEKVQSELQQEIKKLDSNYIVSKRSAIAGGTEIVSLEYHIATTQEAVLTPLYQLQEKNIKDHPFYPPYIPKNGKGGVAHV